MSKENNKIVSFEEFTELRILKELEAFSDRIRVPDNFTRKELLAFLVDLGYSKNNDQTYTKYTSNKDTAIEVLRKTMRKKDGLGRQFGYYGHIERNKRTDTDIYKYLKGKHKLTAIQIDLFLNSRASRHAMDYTKNAPEFIHDTAYRLVSSKHTIFDFCKNLIKHNKKLNI